MDVTLCRYGRDTSETQIEMVREIINQTFTALWFRARPIPIPPILIGADTMILKYRLSVHRYR